MKHLILTSLIVLLISLVACGKPSDEQEPPPNQELVVNYEEIVAAHQYLLKENAKLEAECERLIAREGEYLTAVRTLEDANLALGIELGIVKSLGEQRFGDYEDLLNEVVALREEKKDWHILAKKEYEAILAQYNELNALYPPKSFPNKETLVEWRVESGNITGEKPLLVLQNRAMKEGYLVSVCPELDYCAVIAGGYWYKINAEDKNLVEKIGKVK